MSGSAFERARQVSAAAEDRPDEEKVETFAVAPLVPILAAEVCAVLAGAEWLDEERRAFARGFATSWLDELADVEEQRIAEQGSGR